MSYNKAREARAAAEVTVTPTTPIPTERQLARAAFKERQAAERARSIKTWDQMSNRGSRNGKNAGLPRAYARAEARFAERAVKRTAGPLDASTVEHFDGEEQYLAAPTANAEINIMDIIQPARGKSARVFAAERARHPDSIPYHLLHAGNTLSMDDYISEDIPAELIEELFANAEAVRPAPRPVEEVDSDRTDDEHDDGAVQAEEEDEEQWELATVGVSEFSFVSVAG